MEVMGTEGRHSFLLAWLPALGTRWNSSFFAKA